MNYIFRSTPSLTATDSGTIDVRSEATASKVKLADKDKVCSISVKDFSCFGDWKNPYGLEN